MMPHSDSTHDLDARGHMFLAKAFLHEGKLSEARKISEAVLRSESDPGHTANAQLILDHIDGMEGEKLYDQGRYKEAL